MSLGDRSGREQELWRSRGRTAGQRRSLAPPPEHCLLQGLQVALASVKGPAGKVDTHRVDADIVCGEGGARLSQARAAPGAGIASPPRLPHQCCGPHRRPPRPFGPAPWTPGLQSWGPGGSGSCKPPRWRAGSGGRGRQGYPSLTTTPHPGALPLPTCSHHIAPSQAHRGEVRKDRYRADGQTDKTQR